MPIIQNFVEISMLLDSVASAYKRKGRLLILANGFNKAERPVNTTRVEMEQ
jgi:hypothetical protein